MMYFCLILNSFPKYSTLRKVSILLLSQSYKISVIFYMLAYSGCCVVAHTVFITFVALLFYIE